MTLNAIKESWDLKKRIKRINPQKNISRDMALLLYFLQNYLLITYYDYYLYILSQYQVKILFYNYALFSPSYNHKCYSLIFKSTKNI